MKKLSLLFGLLSITTVAFGATHIIYRYSDSGNESVSAGNIRFPNVGSVDARKVCFDQTARVYRTTLPATFTESCSFSTVSVSSCTEAHGHMIQTPVPAQDITAPEFLSVQKCIKYVSAPGYEGPQCVESVAQKLQQPVDYTFLKYQVESITGDGGSGLVFADHDMKICE